jgi:hypothetical protein
MEWPSARLAANAQHSLSWGSIPDREKLPFCPYKNEAQSNREPKAVVENEKRVRRLKGLVALAAMLSDKGAQQNVGELGETGTEKWLREYLGGVWINVEGCISRGRPD